MLIFVKRCVIYRGGVYPYIEVANRSAYINQIAYDGRQWGRWLMVTWFCKT